MAKQLQCNDLMPGCDFVAKGETEQEVMQKAAAHAKDVHDIQEVTPDLAAKVKGAIKTV